MPEEVADYFGKNTIYSPDELQDRNSIFFGLWCIYFLLERQKGTPFLRYYTKEDMVANLSLITLIFKKYFSH